MRVEIIDDTHQRFNKRIYYRNEKGYYVYYSGFKTYKLHREVWKRFNGKIPKGYDIHHKDFNKNNNQIENLLMVSREQHMRLHNLIP